MFSHRSLVFFIKKTKKNVKKCKKLILKIWYEGGVEFEKVPNIGPSPRGGDPPPSYQIFKISFSHFFYVFLRFFDF